MAKQTKDGKKDRKKSKREARTMLVCLPATLDLDTMVEQNPTIDPIGNESRKCFEPVPVRLIDLKWIVGTIIYFRYLQNE